MATAGMARPCFWPFVATLCVAGAGASNGSGPPQFLTWRELQPVKIKSKASCRCANTSGLEGLVQPLCGNICLLRDKTATAGLTVADPSVCFPPDYGVGECRMWDAGVGGCASEDPEPYCFHVWCYVDPDSCTAGDVSKSTFFHPPSGHKPHYSYMACGVVQGDNPYFTLSMPVHLILAAVFTAIVVPLLAFAGWFFVSRIYPAVVPVGPPWVLLWLTVTIKWTMNILQFDERIPRFPSARFTDSVLDAIVLFFILVGVHRMLTWVDTQLQHARFMKHGEDHRRKQVQILESVLLYQKLHENSWADVLMDGWRPFYRTSQQLMVLIWVVTILEFPMLSAWITSGLAATLLLLLLGILFSFKDDLVAAIVLAYEKPFEVADIISLHSVSNNISVMNAVAVGFVEKLGIVHIAIRNFDMRLQYVPTHVFTQGTVRNWNARQYRLSHWMLVMSMRTPPERVAAFREGVEQVLMSHPSCKTDGYIKVCVKSLSEGGFMLEVICFTKPHADHHAFKLDMNLSFSRLATRLGVDFVWQGISRESAASTVPGFQFSGAEGGGGTTPSTKDLIFEGRFTRGNLVGKFSKARSVKLAPALEQAPSDAFLSCDLLFSMPLSDPAVVADKAIHWTKDHPTLKGELRVLVDEAMLRAIMPKRPVFGGAVEVIAVATVTRRGGSPELGSAEVLATCRSHPRRLSKFGEVTWGETLALGEVALDRPTEGAKSKLMLQLAVGHKTAAGHFTILGVVEKPLTELVQDAWNDQHVKVTWDETPAGAPPGDK